MYLHGLKPHAKLGRLVGNIGNMHIHSYNKRITITDIGNCMHSYHGLIQVLMLITDSYLFGSPVGVTELILMQNLYL